MVGTDEKLAAIAAGISELLRKSWVVSPPLSLETKMKRWPDHPMSKILKRLEFATSESGTESICETTGPEKGGAN